jgi:ribonuclease HI
MITIYCDGGSRGNPGKSASAFVVTENENVLFKQSNFLGTNTNNFAEYSAVNFAVDYLIKEKINEEIVVNLDSQLVERQLNGFYKVKNKILKEFHQKILSKVKVNNLNVKFVWGYRNKNKLADSLVNEELDRHQLSTSTGK